MTTRKWTCLIIALFMIGIIVGVARAQDGSAESFRVKFKLDNATTKGLYMGEVWLRRPNFTASHSGRFFTVEARAVGLDSQGSEVDIAATWKSGDPSLVRISPTIESG